MSCSRTTTKWRHWFWNHGTMTQAHHKSEGLSLWYFFLFFLAVMSCQAKSSITYNLQAKTTKKPSIELDEVREIPGFRVIMKAVLRSQIQYLVSISQTHPPLPLVCIDPDKESLLAENCKYFLTHQFKHVFWVLKRTVSLRRFFWVPTTYVLVEK